MEFKRIAACLCVIALSVSGCATNYANKRPAEVGAGITVKNSEFDSAITYIGPQVMSETRRGLFVDNETLQLIAKQDKSTKKIKYGVYVRILYSFDWRFYNTVSFKGGATEDLKQLSQKVDACTGAGCIHTEEVAFPIDLDKLTQGELEFRLNSKSGVENVLHVKKDYIDGFVQSVRTRAGSA
jgi:hypothetical protein